MFPDATSAWKNLVLPVGLSLVFVYAVVAALGWWRPVFVDRRPVARWVWAIPIIMVVTIVGGINYGGLSDVGMAVAAPLLLGTLMVGFAEEGLFRGIGVTTFRVNGFSEGRVALWSSVLFGLAHGTNIFIEGPGAILQVLVTVAAGYFFYLVRRVSGALVVAALLHGLWDFGLLSSGIVEDELYAGSAVFVLADVVMVVLLLVRRRRIERRPAGAAAEGGLTTA